MDNQRKILNISNLIGLRAHNQFLLHHLLSDQLESSQTRDSNNNKIEKEVRTW